jgi:type I restriction enzyme S subunit
MSKLKELIDKLCPDGVEYTKLDNILDYEQPTPYIVKSTEYNDSYNTPVLTAGQTFILGYTNEQNGIYKADKNSPIIIFDDFTTSFHWVDFDFKVKSSAIKILKPKLTFKGSFKYVLYTMECINFEAVNHTRHWISKYSQFEIPLPPIEVQEEIVRILDNFTKCTAELQAELQAREEQYEYYRNKLLSFEGRTDVEYKKLGEVCKVLRGKRLTTKELSSNFNIPVYHGGVEPIGYYDKSNREANSTMLINVGASAGTVGFCNKEFWSSDGCFCFSHNDLIMQKFLFYALQSIENIIKAKVRKAGIPTLDNKEIERISIPLPPIEVQEEIVNILDKFETLVNDLSQGLPAEIEARQNQYEFYRNKLLSFKRLTT